MNEITGHPVDYAAAYSAVMSRACAAFAYLAHNDVEMAKSVLGEAMGIRRLVESPIVVCKTGDPLDLESNSKLTRPASGDVPATGGAGLGSGDLLGADVLPEGKP